MKRQTSGLFYQPFLKEVFFSFFKHRSQNSAVYINNYHEQTKTNKPKITSCPRMLADLLKELHVLLES